MFRGSSLGEVPLGGVPGLLPLVLPDESFEELLFEELLEFLFREEGLTRPVSALVCKGAFSPLDFL